MSGMEREREFVASLYPGPRWKRKVARMPDSQVLAIFFRERDRAQKPKLPQDQKESQSDAGSDIPF